MNSYSHQNYKKVAVSPAATIWNRECPSELDDQVRFFNENGFLILKGLCSPETVSTMLDEIKYMAENYKTLPRVREGFSVEDPENWPNQDMPVFRKIGGFYEFTNVLSDHCKNPVIMTILTRLMDNPIIELYREIIMMKQAVIGREKPWHQDAAYWSYEPKNFVSAMTALDSATVTNGALQVIPGSHKWGELPHAETELQVTLTAEQQAATAYVELEPGDVLLFHGLLLHGSEENKSDVHRRACIVSYKTPAFEYVGQGGEKTCPILHRAH